MKILLVEDSEQLNKGIATILKRNGHIVDCAFDGVQATTFLNEGDYDIVILDVMLPKKDGFEVLKEMRGKGIDFPVLMLTAKSTVQDRIAGLDLGADDYLCKPFNVEELLARVRSISRRKGKTTVSNELKYGDFSFDIQKSLIVCGNKEAIITNKEAQILKLLVENEGRIVSPDEITEKAWDVEAYSTSENIWVFISYLRKKLEQIGSKVKIKSLRFKGYYLELSDD